MVNKINPKIVKIQTNFFIQKREVSRVFQWSIMWISKVQRVFKVFDECFTEVSGCFKEVLRVFQGSFKVGSRKF